MSRPKAGDSRINPDTGLWEELVPHDDGTHSWLPAPERITLTKCGERLGYRTWAQAFGDAPGYVTFIRADIADEMTEALEDCAEWLLGDIEGDRPRPGLASEMRSKVVAALAQAKDPE